jgi:1,4-dihydroxy-2-naphthoate octaprenyltransferase
MNMKNYIYYSIIIIIIISNLYCANNLRVVLKEPSGAIIILNCKDTSKAFHEFNLLFFLNEYLTIGYTSVLAEGDGRNKNLANEIICRYSF